MADFETDKRVTSVAAAKAKNRFGELLDMAQRGPVSIEKHGRSVAVIVSAEEYGALEALKLKALRVEIGKGLDDLDTGRVEDGDEAFRRARSRIG